MKILIVEDDLKLASIIKYRLQKESYAVEIASTGSDAMIFLNDQLADLMILDLNLPDISGLEICNAARKEYPCLLILILTARDKSSDIVMGLDAGADDYLSKPFDSDVLSARIRALFRRDMKSRDPIINVQDVQIDPAEHAVWKNGHRIYLTRKEFAVLEYLMRNTSQVISSEQLLQHVWGSQGNEFTNSPAVHIQSLRYKLGDNPHEPIYIETVKGVGYRFIGTVAFNEKDSTH